jgi:HK97 family phage prohead protease
MMAEAKSNRLANYVAAEHKQRLQFEIKGISDTGTFEGLLSPYGNVDDGGDLVEPGAYAKTLKEHGGKIPLLWQHCPDEPIGELELSDQSDGLYCKGKLLMELPTAHKAYLLLKAGVVKGLSIGFRSIRDAVDEGVRRLKEIRLYEGSIVTFPMNESALITSVKSRETKGDFTEELTERQLMDAGCQMECSLSRALHSVVWADMTREEKISAVETILDQFRDAYMAYFPAFIAAYSDMYGMKARTLETKTGRTLSAATKKSIISACDQIKAGHESLLALLSDDADDGGKSAAITSPASAASDKSEPADHSAITDAIENLKGAFKWTK